MNDVAYWCSLHTGCDETVPSVTDFVTVWHTGVACTQAVTRTVPSVTEFVTVWHTGVACTQAVLRTVPSVTDFVTVFAACWCRLHTGCDKDSAFSDGLCHSVPKLTTQCQTFQCQSQCQYYTVQCGQYIS